MRPLFEHYSFGKAALAKFGDVLPNFVLYDAGWLGDKPSEWTVMKVVGCQLRKALSGPRKGQICVPVKGTKRTCYLTRDEINAFEDSK